MQKMWETWVWSLGREDPLEEGMATHSSILAWRIPWTEEPDGLWSMGSQRVRHKWSDLPPTQKYNNTVITRTKIETFICCCCVASVMSDSLLPHGLQPTRLPCPWNSSGKNTGVGCHSIRQGIFWTQRSNPGLLHCRQIFCCLSHQGSLTGKYEIQYRNRKRIISIILLLPLLLLLSRFSRVQLCVTP